MQNIELSEQELVRRQSLDELKQMGVEPYPASGYDVNAHSIEIINEFNDNAEQRRVTIAGRIMSRRIWVKHPLLS